MDAELGAPEAFESTASERPPHEVDEADEGFRRVDPRHVTAERLTGLVVCAVMAVASAVALSITTFVFDWSRVVTALVTGGAGVFLVALLVYSLRWPALEYRHTSYRLDDRRIEIRRGVIWRATISIPRNRIQHTDVAQGPIQRHFDLATLVLHTAGTHNYEVTLSGLARGTALAVRERLLVEREPDAV